MFVEKEISMYDFICAISEAVDLVSPALSSHHKKVAYISYRLAQEMGLPDDEIQDIVMASMLHDIGAFTIGERLKALTFEYFNSELTEHALLGYKLLKGFAPLAQAARLIKYHHTDYNKSAYHIPTGSYVIHLADGVCVLFDESRETLAQVPEVLDIINQRQKKFHPAAIGAFSRLSRQESFWVGAFFPSYSDFLLKKVISSKKIVDMETLRSFSKVISHIIDFRSRYTATHSSGVAAVAQDIAAISGFSESDCQMMEIAGYLHDFGKLSVPNDILEKNSKLNKEEFNAIRKLAYYTYLILSKVDGLEDVAAWAAHQQDWREGNMYPIDANGEDPSWRSRVVAVADILTALSEDRPYRHGMSKEKTAEILLDMAGNGQIDKNIVELTNQNFFRINGVRVKAQQEARNEYINFYETTNQLLTSA